MTDRWKMKIFGSGAAVLWVVFAVGSPGFANENTLRGGISLGQNYDSNINRVNQGRETEWTTSVSPSLTLLSADKRQEYFFRYAPDLVHSYRTDNERVDHSLLARFDKKWTEHVKTFLQDSFRRAEEPYEDEEVLLGLSDKRGRNRYSHNSFLSRLEYQYAQESFAKVSYENQVLDNSEAGQDDFVKHTPGVGITHRFNHQWSSVADYTYTNGQFDESDDLDRHAADLYLYHHLTPSSKVFGRYGYTDVDYDSLQVDYHIQTATLGLERSLSPTMTLSLEGGGSFLSRDTGSDRDSFYFRMGIQEELEKGLLSFSAESGLDEQQFSGVSDQGVSRFWKIKGDLSHDFLKYLQGVLSCSYREDTYLERVPEEDEQEFRTDAALIYSFWQHYKATVKYSYVNVDADVAANRYDDNRVFLILSTERDLLKW
ncbi:hypothetical protein ACUUL3_02180 [Thiovibrio sp. JS02]